MGRLNGFAETANALSLLHDGVEFEQVDVQTNDPLADISAQLASTAVPLPKYDLKYLADLTDRALFGLSLKMAADPYFLDKKAALEDSLIADILNVKKIEQKLCDISFVAKKLIILRSRQRELQAMAHQMLGGRKQNSFICAANLESFQAKQKRMEKWLGDKTVFLRDGDGIREVPLSEFAKTDVQKRAEIYTDMLVIQELAAEKGYVSIMLTLTAPGFYHSNPSSGGRDWQHMTSRDANAFLNECWRLFNTRINARKIDVLGMRVVEPHDDGCPHQHVALFVAPDNVAVLKTMFNSLRREVAEREDLDFIQWDLNELDEAERDKLWGCRETTEVENPQSPANYLLKHVTRNTLELKAYFSAENGGVMRQFSFIGFKGFKTKYQYLYKQRHALVNESGILGEIGHLLTDKTLKEHERKLRFVKRYNDLVQVHYKRGYNKFGERVTKGISHVTVVDERSEQRSEALANATFSHEKITRLDTSLKGLLTIISKGTSTQLHEIDGGKRAANDDPPLDWTEIDRALGF